MLSGTSSFLRKRTGHKLTAIPACHKRRQSPIATRGAQLKSVKIKEKAEPETPIASRFSLGYVDKKDTRAHLGTQTATQRQRLRFGKEEQGSGRMTPFLP